MYFITIVYIGTLEYIYSAGKLKKIRFYIVKNNLSYKNVVFLSNHKNILIFTY